MNSFLVILAFILTTVWAGSPDARAEVGLSLYDDFSGTRLDGAQWRTLDFVREIREGRLMLQHNQAGPPNDFLNTLVFANPTTIQSFQADVRLNAFTSPAGGSAQIRLRGNYYNDGTSSLGATGDIRAQLYLRGSGKNLDLRYYVYKCADETCGTATDVIPATTITQIALREVHTLGIGWDGALFTFTLDGVMVTVVDPRPFQAIGRATPNIPGKVLGTMLKTAGPGGEGWIDVDFDNVLVNGTPYDDFSAATLDPAKWTSLESVRGGAGGRHLSKVAATGVVSASERSNLLFADQNAVTAVRADMTVTDYTSTNCLVQARVLGGSFYNDGASTGADDLTGEVQAFVRVGSSSGGPLTAQFFAARCNDSQCANFKTLKATDSDSFGTVNKGETHSLFLIWDGTLFTYGMDQTTKTFNPTTSHPVAKPPAWHYKDIRTQVTVLAAGASGYIAATYDNIMVNDAAVTPPGLATSLQERVTGDVVSAGVGLRGTGTGTITLAGIPAGAAVQRALLYWATLGKDATFTAPTLNGTPVAGTLIGSSDDTFSGAHQNFAYRADVTPLVTGNGSYTVAGLPASGPTVNDSQGASLVVLYSLAGAPLRTIVINDGAVTLAGARISYYRTALSGFMATNPATGARLTFLVGDGQAATPDYAGIGGTILATNPFSGGDGNSWDTRTYEVATALAPGATSATAVVSTDNDPLLWVAAILSVPQADPPPGIRAATSATPDGTYHAGSAIAITLDFSEPVSSTGLALALNSGATIGTGPLNTVTSWSGTYTVAAGQSTSDLNITAVTGTITAGADRSSDNPAIPPGYNLGDGKNIAIHAPPGITGATTTTVAGTYQPGGTIDITLHFSTAVSSAGLEIALNSGGSLGTGALYNVTTWNGTYRIDSGQTVTALNITAITGTLSDGAGQSTENPAIPAGQNLGDSASIVIATKRGDLDHSGTVDAADAVLALEALSGLPAATLHRDAEVNQDGKIGLAEAVYALQGRDDLSGSAAAGAVALPEGFALAPATLTLSSPAGNAAIGTDGRFTVAEPAGGGPATVMLTAPNGKLVLLGHVDTDAPSFNEVSAMSTAEELLFLATAASTLPVDEWPTVYRILAAAPETATLAGVIAARMAVSPTAVGEQDPVIVAAVAQAVAALLPAVPKAGPQAAVGTQGAEVLVTRSPSALSGTPKVLSVLVTPGTKTPAPYGLTAGPSQDGNGIFLMNTMRIHRHYFVFRTGYIPANGKASDQPVALPKWVQVADGFLPATTGVTGVVSSLVDYFAGKVAYGPQTTPTIPLVLDPPDALANTFQVYAVGAGGNLVTPPAELFNQPVLASVQSARSDAIIFEAMREILWPIITKALPANLNKAVWKDPSTAITLFKQFLKEAGKVALDYNGQLEKGNLWPAMSDVLKAIASNQQVKDAAYRMIVDLAFDQAKALGPEAVSNMAPVIDTLDNVLAYLKIVDAIANTLDVGCIFGQLAASTDYNLWDSRAAATSLILVPKSAHITNTKPTADFSVTVTGYPSSSLTYQWDGGKLGTVDDHHGLKGNLITTGQQLVTYSVTGKTLPATGTDVISLEVFDPHGKSLGTVAGVVTFNAIPTPVWRMDQVKVDVDGPTNPWGYGEVNPLLNQLAANPGDGLILMPYQSIPGVNAPWGNGDSMQADGGIYLQIAPGANWFLPESNEALAALGYTLPPYWSFTRGPVDNGTISGTAGSGPIGGMVNINATMTPGELQGVIKSEIGFQNGNELTITKFTITFHAVRIQ